MTRKEKKAFDKYGRKWRDALRTLWTTGADSQIPHMRRVRNTLGPSGIELF